MTSKEMTATPAMEQMPMIVMNQMNECKSMMMTCMEMMNRMSITTGMPMMKACMKKMDQVMPMMKDPAMMNAGMTMMEDCMKMMMECMKMMGDEMMPVMQPMLSQMPAMRSRMERMIGQMMGKDLMSGMMTMQMMGMILMDMERMMSDPGMNRNPEMMMALDRMRCMMLMNQMGMMMADCLMMMKGTKMPVMIDRMMGERGMNEIKMAEMEMPGLMALRMEYSKTKPLAGMKMACSMHITVQTAVMMKTMMEMGAEVRCCACNMNTTQDDAAAAMNMMGIPTFGRKGMTTEEMMMGMEMGIFMDGAMTMPVNMLFDTTGTMTRRMMEKHPEMMPELMGVCMDSVMGMQMMVGIMQEGNLMMPMMNMNTSPRKAKIDYRYGSMESLVGSIRSLTGMMIAGKVCVVAGYGDMGKACADALKMAGARVIVTEIDPFCALQAAMDGCMVMKMDEACQMADIIVTATENRDVIVDRHFRMMKNNCIVCNMSDYDSEIDMQWLNTQYGTTKMRMKPMVDMYAIEGKNVIVLGEGCSVNMAGSMGYSSFIMSACFTTQILAMMEFYTDRNQNEKKIYRMPEGAGAKATMMHLNQLGIQLDTLTPEQEACMKQMEMIMPAMIR